MAATSPPSARLIASLAALVAVLQAVLAVTGPWQPVSVILGWLAVIFVGVTLLTGYAAGISLAAGVSIIRVGVEAVSGEFAGGPLVATLLLALLIELTAASLEARRSPVDVWAALGRALLVASAMAMAVGSLLVLTTGLRRPPGPAWSLVGVAAAVLIAGTVLALQRRRAGT